MGTSLYIFKCRKENLRIAKAKGGQTARIKNLDTEPETGSLEGIHKHVSTAWK